MISRNIYKIWQNFLLSNCSHLQNLSNLYITPNNNLHKMNRISNLTYCCIALICRNEHLSLEYIIISFILIILALFSSCRVSKLPYLII